MYVGPQCDWNWLRASGLALTLGLSIVRDKAPYHRESNYYLCIHF